MNVHEGVRRMKLAGFWLAIIPAGLWILVFCMQLFLLLGSRGVGAVLSGLGLADALVLAVPGVLLWLAAWIVEGFAENPD